MIKERLYGEVRVALLAHPHRACRGAPQLPQTAWGGSFDTFDPAARPATPRRAFPYVPLTERKPAPARHESGHSAPSTAIRRVVAVIRLWWGLARSRQQLRELSDHMLEDIGLRREDFVYEEPKPFRHRD
jgi:uncharacterized protein YjiS (DUF1127 family)